jgi:hypothetical protein
MRTLYAWGAGKVSQNFQVGFGSGFSGVWSCLLSVELVGIMYDGFSLTRLSMAGVMGMMMDEGVFYDFEICFCCFL